MLNTTEGAIENEQSRDFGNTGPRQTKHQVLEHFCEIDGWFCWFIMFNATFNNTILQ